MARRRKKRSWFLMLARIFSIIFSPFYLPIVSMIALFTFTHLLYLPLMYKAMVLAVTYIFTILLPSLLIRIYKEYHGKKLFHLSNREKRMVPYFISIGCFLSAYYIMQAYRVPHIISIVIIAALMVQIVCALFNLVIKISLHMAAIGGLTGGVMAFSLLIQFNALWWIIALILLAGLVGTARMMLRIHTLTNICLGYIVGFVTTLTVISVA